MLALILNVVFLNKFVSVLVGFIGSLHFFWTPAHENYFYVLSATVWVAFTSWVSNYFGYIRLPVFVVIQLVIFGTFCYSAVKSRRCESFRALKLSQLFIKYLYTYLMFYF